MPMGDSITAGIRSDPGGYRALLHGLLRNGGFTFDFVGSKTTPGDTCPDTDHWAAGSWQISDTPATIGGRSYVSIQGQNRSGLYDELPSAISTTFFSTDAATTRNIILLQIGINYVLHKVVDGERGSFDSDAGSDGRGEDRVVGREARVAIEDGVELPADFRVQGIALGPAVATPVAARAADVEAALGPPRIGQTTSRRRVRDRTSRVPPMHEKIQSRCASDSPRRNGTRLRPSTS